jgi:hypothetical protein
MAIVRIRKPAKQVAYRRRFSSLSSQEQVLLRKLRLVLLALIVKLTTQHVLDEERNRLNLVLRIVAVKYLSISLDPDYEALPRPLRMNRTIESFSDTDCYVFFQFTRVDLMRLLDLLRFPNEVTFSNRAKMSGEEVFLRGLYELVSGETKYKIAVNVFGRCHTEQSRAFRWFVKHMYLNFKGLIHRNLSWWYRNGFWRLSYEAIYRKLTAEVYPSNAPVPYKPALFIDCKCSESEVVGGGPAEDGANSRRWDADIQRAFYNGWKSIHGLKHQTVDDAFGFTEDIEGPCSLRRNDLAVLRIR